MSGLPTNTIEEITIEILVYKNNTARNIIEIGKRLNEAKEILPHGEWGKWLEERVQFSDRTAQRFMKVATEFSNTTALSDLAPSKVFALLDLPPEERQPFIESNPVNEMSTRELQSAIKAQKEAERRAAEAEAKAAEVKEEVNDLIKDNQRLNKELSKVPVQEVKVEVIPENVKAEMELLVKNNSKLKGELARLKLESEVQKDTAQVKSEFEAKISTFTGRIERFLRDMSSLGYVGNDVFRTSQYAQREYDEALTSLEKWCSDIRQKLDETNKNMVIEMEG